MPVSCGLLTQCNPASNLQPDPGIRWHPRETPRRAWGVWNPAQRVYRRGRSHMSYRPEGGGGRVGGVVECAFLDQGWRVQESWSDLKGCIDIIPPPPPVVQTIKTSCNGIQSGSGFRNVTLFVAKESRISAQRWNARRGGMWMWSSEFDWIREKWLQTRYGVVGPVCWVQTLRQCGQINNHNSLGVTLVRFELRITIKQNCIFAWNTYLNSNNNNYVTMVTMSQGAQVFSF